MNGQRLRPSVPSTRPSIDVLLDREVDQLDRLMRDYRSGKPLDAARYAELEERTQGIAQRLVSAWRGQR